MQKNIKIHEWSRSQWTRLFGGGGEWVIPNESSCHIILTSSTKLISPVPEKECYRLWFLNIPDRRNKITKFI